MMMEEVQKKKRKNSKGHIEVLSPQSKYPKDGVKAMETRIQEFDCLKLFQNELHCLYCHKVYSLLYLFVGHL
jgi:hypothetical protein